MTTTSSIPGNIPHKHLHSRLSYLHQAAAHFSHLHFMQSQGAREQAGIDDATPGNSEPVISTPPSMGFEVDAISSDVALENENILQNIASSYVPQVLPLARYMLSQLRGVSLKAQTHLSQNMKHSICKRCDAFLVIGDTASSHVENRSRGARKPWADVLVVTCTLCNSSIRLPIGSRRQICKADRLKGSQIQRGSQAISLIRAGS